MTLLPPTVAILARKPWVLLRRILLGWYVRFIRIAAEFQRAGIIDNPSGEINRKAFDFCTALKKNYQSQDGESPPLFRFEDSLSDSPEPQESSPKAALSSNIHDLEIGDSRSDTVGAVGGAFAVLGLS